MTTMQQKVVEAHLSNERPETTKLNKNKNNKLLIQENEEENEVEMIHQSPLVLLKTRQNNISSNGIHHVSSEEVVINQMRDDDDAVATEITVATETTAAETASPENNSNSLDAILSQLEEEEDRISAMKDTDTSKRRMIFRQQSSSRILKSTSFDDAASGSSSSSGSFDAGKMVLNDKYEITVSSSPLPSPSSSNNNNCENITNKNSKIILPDGKNATTTKIPSPPSSATNSTTVVIRNDNGEHQQQHQQQQQSSMMSDDENTSNKVLQQQCSSDKKTGKNKIILNNGLTPDEVLRDARKVLENQRKQMDERAQLIVENAIQSSLRRDAQLRSTSEVLRRVVAGGMIPPILRDNIKDTAALSSFSISNNITNDDDETVIIAGRDNNNDNIIINEQQEEQLRRLMLSKRTTTKALLLEKYTTNKNCTVTKTTTTTTTTSMKNDNIQKERSTTKLEEAITTATSTTSRRTIKASDEDIKKADDLIGAGDYIVSRPGHRSPSVSPPFPRVSITAPPAKSRNNNNNDKPPLSRNNNKNPNVNNKDDSKRRQQHQQKPLPIIRPPNSMIRDTPPRMSFLPPLNNTTTTTNSSSSSRPLMNDTPPRMMNDTPPRMMNDTPPRMMNDTPPRMQLSPSPLTMTENATAAISIRSTPPRLAGLGDANSSVEDLVGDDLVGDDTSTVCTTSPNSNASVTNSVDDYERAVRKLPSPSKMSGVPLSRENMLYMIDGISAGEKHRKNYSRDDDETVDDDLTMPDFGKEIKFNERGDDKMPSEANTPSSTFSSYLEYFIGGSMNKKNEEGGANKGADFVRSSLQAFSPLACGAIEAVGLKRDEGNNNNSNNTSDNTSNYYYGKYRRHHNNGNNKTYPRGSRGNAIAAEVLQDVNSFIETIHERAVDPRMPSWISHLTAEEKKSTGEDADRPLSEYFSTLGESRTIIVHEIMRGNWTWCTAWSPDGSRLAMATENHHLAVVDTCASTVWRVRHDRRINVPVKNQTTHSIRSIAWGDHFIAIGGTGSAVSILSPIEPYPIVHTITGTGFVGSLAWRMKSTILAVGSREDKCSIYFLTAHGGAEQTVCSLRSIISQELYTINRKDWVNVVTFSPNGSVLAIGDRSGKLSVYSFEVRNRKSPKLGKITNFNFGAAILDLEWSPDGKWLYTGGEDFAMTVLDTTKWEIVHKTSRDRWMQFVSSSNRGTHVAVGGGASEVTILDVANNWKSTLNIELKGLVPLSAKWHPKDQFLALTGQDNSVIAIETTNARHIKGHYLQSISPVLQVEFSPDGQILAVGNEAGVVSFYRSNKSSFVTTYEIVLAEGSSQSIVWSPNGSYVMVGSSDTLAIIGQATDPHKRTTNSGNGSRPPSTSGGGSLGIRKVIRDVDTISTISIHIGSRFAAIVGESISILDAANDFNFVKRWDDLGPMYASAWSLDGTWLATTGVNSGMVILDTSSESVTHWHTVFTLDCEDAGNALAWGPSVAEGLQYLAFGGDNQKVTIIEIRTNDGTWETVLEVKRSGAIHALDWSDSGLLAAAVGDGTVTIIDLGYLNSGTAVNEMDYNWQRQGITCFTEIRRNQGSNAMRTIRWIPSKASDESLLAIGGSDGALEVIDLTERSYCKGFVNNCREN